MSKAFGKSQGLSLDDPLVRQGDTMLSVALGIAVVACILMIVTYGLDQAVYKEQCKKLFKRSIPDEEKKECRKKAIENNRKPAALPLLITGLVLLLPSSIFCGIAIYKFYKAENAENAKRFIAENAENAKRFITEKDGVF